MFRDAPHFDVRDYLRKEMMPHFLCPGCGHGMALRALGARIGRRVHIHRVDLTHGGWDLLDIGEEEVASSEQRLHLVLGDQALLLTGATRLGARLVDKFYTDLVAGADVKKFNLDGTPMNQ